MNMQQFKQWKWHVAATLGLFLMLPTLLHAQWVFDEDAPTFTSGNLTYAYMSGVAECRGLVEGSTETNVTVPATVTNGGRTYNVVSIGDGAFIRSSVTEAHFLSTDLQIGQLVFSGTIERLYLSATVPPALDYYLAVDPATFTFPLVRVYVPKGSLEAYLANEWWAQHVILDGGEERTLSATTERAGTLASTIRAQGVNFKGINHLIVAGPLNDDDILLVRDSITNIFTLDLSQAAIRKLPKEAFQGCRFSSIQLPATLRDMGNSAFGVCPNLEELVVPEGVLCADNLVYSCPKLRSIDLHSTLVSADRVLNSYNFDETQTYQCTVTCRSFFPPKAGIYAVFSYGSVDVKVRVPAIAQQDYATASGWKDLTIETFDEMPASISVVGQRELSTDGLPAGYSPNLHLEQFGNYGSYSDNNAFGLLTVKCSKTLNVGEFTAYTDLYDDRYYSGRYGCELIAEAPMTAQSVRIDFDMGEGDWYYLSFPFDVKVSDIKTDADIQHWVIRSYSGANRAAMRGQQWQDMPYASTLEARRGYIWQVATSNDPDSYYRDNLRISVEATTNTIGNMFAHEDVSIPLADYASTYEHNAGWNFIGNPYPCYYRIGALKQTMPVTVKGNRYGYDQYRTYSPVDDINKVLHPYEAFFVQKPAGVDALVFGAEGRVAFNSSNARLSALGGFSAGNGNRQVINLVLTANDIEDNARVVLNPDAKAGYERERDAVKFFSQSEQVPQLYTFIGSEPCAINERTEADGRVMLGVRTSSATTCVLSVDLRPSTPNLSPLMLEDRLTGTLTDLTKAAYTFTSRPGRDDQRFVLHVGASATSISDIHPSSFPSQSSTFNLQGQPVSNSYKGFVIENGKLTIKR